MTKTILVTGATDGIGLETARQLVALGHDVLLHGRSESKLSNLSDELGAHPKRGRVETYRADLSRLEEVEAMALEVSERHARLDVLLNNAGVFRIKDASTPSGIDARFVVNALAPYLLTRRLLPRLDASARVLNLSSAAQASVNLEALQGRVTLSHGEAYAQSKLALTMWSRHLAGLLGPSGPAILSVNPGSMLGTKMVQEGFGVSGKDINIGADVLTRLAIQDPLEAPTGSYFDNDLGRVGLPHPDALDDLKCEALVQVLEALTS